MGAFDDLIPARKNSGLIESGPANQFADLVPNGGGVQDFEPRQFTDSERAARLAGITAQGVSSGVVKSAAAPLDLSGMISRGIGLVSPDTPPISSAYLQAVDDVASVPLRIRDAFAQGSLDPIFASRDKYDTRIKPANTTERTAEGAGEGVGTALASVVPANVVANTARAGTVTHGVARTLAQQPLTQVAASAVGGGVTGATGNPLYGLGAALAVPLAASGIRGIVSPVTNQLTPQEQRLVQAAQAEGIRLTPAQRTGSASLRGIEETMARMPLSNAPMQNAFANQRRQFNRAVLQRAGVAADDASPDTIQRAFNGIGQVFDDLVSRTTANVDPQFGQQIQRVATNYGRRLETDVAPVFQSYMDDLAPLVQAANSGQNPQIAGDVYARIRSDITTRMRETNNLPLRRALGGLVEALDDVVERSTSGALRQEWQEARRHYASLMTIDKAMQGGTQAGRASGDVPFNALTAAVRGGDKVGYSRGRGDLNELARIGDYIASRIPNSGTPERMVWQNMLTGGGLFTAGAASGIGIPAAAAGVAAPYALSRLYNSPAGQAWLLNQLAGRTNFNALYGGQAAREALSLPGNALRQRDER